MKKLELAPSLLSCDFSNLEKAINQIEKNKGSIIHIDVMDGQFVPEITYGQVVIRSIRKFSKLPFDVHLMVCNPENQIKSFIESGADWITFHIESTVHANYLIQEIHQHGKKAGIAICPSTPISVLKEVLEYVDLVLVMTVNPGWGAQKIIPSCVKKIQELKNIREQNDYNFRISVDGGINKNTIDSVIEAGTDIIVSGSSFFKNELDLSVFD